MARTEPQARVLGALSNEPSTVRHVCARAGLSVNATRTALDELAYDGLARSTFSGWLITQRGWCVINLRPYREYRTANA